MEKYKRRDFLRSVALAGAGMSMFGPTELLGKSAPGGVLPGISAKSYSRIVGANERLTVACMGVNARGFAVGTNFANQPDCEVLYTCDVDQRAADKFTGAVKGIQGHTPKAASDFRKALEDKDLDILMVAAPDHWHAMAAILGVQAGKHVYLEKPASHSPREGEMIVEAARKYNKHIQMGNQRRSWPNSVGAIAEIKSGTIGKPYLAKAWYTNNRAPIGIGNLAPVPSWLDFELWQGPAPRRPYKDNLIHYNWHWMWNWGTGEGPNNGTHTVDLARWGLGVDFPVRVSSSGGRYHFTDDWETPDTQIVNIEFANNTMISWEGRSANRQPVEGAGAGVMFYGEKGSILIGDSTSYKVFDITGKLLRHVKGEAVENDVRSLSTPSQKLDAIHIRNFFDGIRTGAKLNSEIGEGHKSTLLMQLGNIALRSGRTLQINQTNGHILNDKKAMKLWTREYQPGWELKV
jgi:predicted dehydrogenase